VSAIVYLPAFGARAAVTFLLDTGADVTVLHPQDSLRLLTASQIRGLSNPLSIGGAGAGQPHYPIEASLIFAHDDPRVTSVPRTIYIAEPSHNVDVESLLGRDVLEEFIVYFDQRAQILTLGD
jgi:hypothetical protein